MVYSEFNHSVLIQNSHKISFSYNTDLCERLATAILLFIDALVATLMCLLVAFQTLRLSGTLPRAT